MFYQHLFKLSTVLRYDHIIVDHHEITADINSYADNVIVINSRDNGNEEFSKVSAVRLRGYLHNSSQPPAVSQHVLYLYVC